MSVAGLARQRQLRKNFLLNEQVLEALLLDGVKNNSTDLHVLLKSDLLNADVLQGVLLQSDAILVVEFVLRKVENLEVQTAAVQYIIDLGAAYQILTTVESFQHAVFRLNS